MRRRISVWVVLALLLGAAAARGQNLFVSQPYATNLTINPAFAGIRADMHAALKYRNQWPKLPGTFVTNLLQADLRLPRYRSGAGISLFHDQAGPSGLTRTEATVSYAYHTPLSKRFTMSGGLGAGYGVQKVQFGDLVFGDQLSADGSLTSPTLENASHFNPIKYLNLQAGTIIYDNRFWLGLSAFHLNRPNQGFSRARSLVPVKYVITTGYKFFINFLLRERPSLSGA